MGAGEGAANIARGEVSLSLNGQAYRVRPSFSALVAAEAETGSLLKLVERAAEGKLLLAEVDALLWHCIADRPADMTRADLGDALASEGIGAALPVLATILRQIVTGGR